MSRKEQQHVAIEENRISCDKTNLIAQDPEKLKFYHFFCGFGQMLWQTYFLNLIFLQESIKSKSLVVGFNRLEQKCHDVNLFICEQYLKQKRKMEEWKITMFALDFYIHIQMKILCDHVRIAKKIILCIVM